MSITAGTEITAPKGFHELAAGATYYFLRSSPRTKLVTLLEFVERPAKIVIRGSAKEEGAEGGKSKKRLKRTIAQLPLPISIRLPREVWEGGLLRRLVVQGETRTMPPWLDALQGLDLAEIDLQRTDAAMTSSSASRRWWRALRKSLTTRISTRSSTFTRAA